MYQSPLTALKPSSHLRPALETFVAQYQAALSKIRDDDQREALQDELNMLEKTSAKSSPTPPESK
jgi:hypothetical protein